MTKAFIVEDDEVFGELLSRALIETNVIRLVGIVSSGETALLEIPRRKPDVILMDIELPRMNGIECIGRLKGFPPLSEASILVLTQHDDSKYVFDALKAGANGYLLKDQISVKDVAQAIDNVKNGGA